MGNIQVQEESGSPTAASSGFRRLRPKSDGWYDVDDAGVEVSLAGDADAIHVDEAGEIAGVASKSPAVAGDLILIEDSADSNNKKSITVADLRITESQITDLVHTDANAIHDNVAAEISAVALKGTPVSGDLLLIEDSAAGNAKKRITIGSLPSGGGGDISNILINEDFIPNNLDQDEIGKYNWRNSKTGTGSQFTYVLVPGRQGVMCVGPGPSGAAGRSAMLLGNNVNAWEFQDDGSALNRPLVCDFTCRLRNSIASANLEAVYLGFIAFSDLTSDGEPADGIYIRFDPSSDTNWSIVTADTSSRTVVAGTTAPLIDTWYRVGFTIRDLGGSSADVQLRVNGVNQGSAITTDIPIGVNLSFGFQILGQGSGTEPLLDVHKILVTQDELLED